MTTLLNCEKFTTNRNVTRKNFQQPLVIFLFYKSHIINSFIGFAATWGKLQAKGCLFVNYCTIPRFKGTVLTPNIYV
jgi:hypothetical protein